MIFNDPKLFSVNRRSFDHFDLQSESGWVVLFGDEVFKHSKEDAAHEVESMGFMDPGIGRVFVFQASANSDFEDVQK